MLFIGNAFEQIQPKKLNEKSLNVNMHETPIVGRNIDRFQRLKCQKNFILLWLCRNNFPQNLIMVG